jgi:hypothetical protein
MSGRQGDSFHGLPVGSLENEYLRLDYLTEAGPRIVRAFPAGVAENVLVETPDFGWDTPYGPYHMRGGHRLWAAPEYPEITYAPDNGPLEVTSLPNGVRLRQSESPVGILKTMDIHLEPERAAVAILHHLENQGSEPLEIAPWALTQLPTDGWAVIPQVQGPLDEGGFLPNRNLVLWPYTRWDDPRLHLGETRLLIESRSSAETPVKIGAFIHQGWVGYLRNGVYFTKRFSPALGLTHPDYGCNVEVYTNNRFIELETLGPLVIVEPGDSIEHLETWEFTSGHTQPTSAAEMDVLLSILNP